MWNPVTPTPEKMRDAKINIDSILMAIEMKNVAVLKNEVLKKCKNVRLLFRRNVVCRCKAILRFFDILLRAPILDPRTLMWVSVENEEEEGGGE